MVSPHQLLHIPGSDSWVRSQCHCQRLKTAGLPSPSFNHKPSSSLKQAPDGNGVRLWKNRVDRIQDPVKGLTLTRRILASGLLLPLHPILSLPPSHPFSLFSSLYLLLSRTCLFEHRSWQNCKASYLFINSLWFPLAPQSRRGFSEQEIPKTALIWSLLCPQVLRNCLTGLLLRLHNPLYIQLEMEEWLTLRINFSSLSTSFLT